MTDEWADDGLDLPAYLNRVGQEAGDPTAATLARLHRAHIAAIPFENLDIVIGRGVRVDLDAVQDKLVRHDRGGYCYEHGVLFGAVLTRFGFGVTRLLARVGHTPERPRPRSHMALQVTADDGVWLADVGFGTGLLEPLPWADGAQARQGGWTFRLVADGGEWFVQERDGNGWANLYGMTTEPQHAVDIEVANHFTSTHPSSPFVGRAVAVREDDHRRTRLLGRTLSTVGPDGVEAGREVDDAELPAVLRERFGIALNPDDLAAVLGSGRRAPQPA
jgi:N-hydroxyarylamine O-acetyltransferase